MRTENHEFESIGEILRRRPYWHYFSIFDSEGNLIHFEKIGDVTNNCAEYAAIKWVIKNVEDRPVTISSDSQTAMSWAKRGGTSINGDIAPLQLEGIILEHQSNNVSDQFNKELLLGGLEI